MNHDETVKRALKYVIMFLVLIAALKYIPQSPLTWTEILIISIIGVIAFAILDMFMPAVSGYSR